jgi:hypothetical protein
MAYIQTHQSLYNHKKIMALAESLDMPEPHVTGHCVYLWLWSLDNAPKGELPASVRSIERAAGWEGDRGVLVSAMVEAKLLDKAEDGTLYIHDWFDYAGKLMVSREESTNKNQNIKRAYRDGTIEKVKKRDGDNCRFCGRQVDWSNHKTATGGTYAHIEPDGPSTIDNLVVSCRGCSEQKGSLTLEDARLNLLQPRQTQMNPSSGGTHKPPLLDDENGLSGSGFIPGMDDGNGLSSSGLNSGMDDENGLSSPGLNDRNELSIPGLNPGFNPDSTRLEKTRVTNKKSSSIEDLGDQSITGENPKNGQNLLLPPNSDSLDPYEEMQIRMQVRMNRVYQARPNDAKALNELLQQQVPVEFILHGIDAAFDRDPNTKISSFAYCAPIIKDLWAVEIAKQEVAVGIAPGKHRSQGNRDSPGGRVVSSELPEEAEVFRQYVHGNSSAN